MIDRLITTRNLLILAVLSFIPTLFFYTVGEEGIYTISSMEMGLSHNWADQTLYGYKLARPPLMNWLVVPITNIIGWENVLIASRLVSIAATLGLALWIYWLNNELFKDKKFALFSSLTLLSLADLLLYRGWLAYTDAVFSFFTFGAIATLWIGTDKKSHPLLFISTLLVGCGLLTKAFTAYVFYGTTLFVLISNKEYRRFLFHPVPIAMFAFSLLLPIAWFHATSEGSSNSSSMLSEIAAKLKDVDWIDYAKRLFTYPLESLLWLAPAPLLAIYFLVRKKIFEPESRRQHFQKALLISAACIAPYWLAPQGGLRYLMPVYPLIALVCARLLWRAGQHGHMLALHWFFGLIVFKMVMVLIAFPLYQKLVRGENYAYAAREIVAHTAPENLYAADSRSIGLNIVSEIDRLQPDRLVIHPPNNWDSGYVISSNNNPQLGTLVDTIKVAKDETYLLCRGPSCSAYQPIGVIDK
ncbi:MAG: glycosyltransferase family 39 protein [Gallionella sp.]|nr:glycosyltransferase family 39 protein [Gallionella sp.]